MIVFRFAGVANPCIRSMDTSCQHLGTGQSDHSSCLFCCSHCFIVSLLIFLLLSHCTVGIFYFKFHSTGDQYQQYELLKEEVGAVGWIGAIPQQSAISLLLSNQWPNHEAEMRRRWGLSSNNPTLRFLGEPTNQLVLFFLQSFRFRLSARESFLALAALYCRMCVIRKSFFPRSMSS